MLNKYYNIFFLLFVMVLIMPAGIYAQTRTFNTWTKVDIEKKLKKWTLASEIELRDSGFFKRTDRFSVQLEASYKVNKFLEVGLAYTFLNVYDQKYDDYQLRNRFSITAQGKKSFGRFDASLREQFELTAKDESDRIKLSGKIDNYAINPEHIWRNKLKIGYDMKGIPLSPSVAVETFFQLNNPEGNVLEKVRYTLALAYKVSKHHEVELFNLWNSKLIELEKATDYVIGAGYKFKF